MAKWIFTRENGPYSYPTLGFTADTNDVIEADNAPDAWWDETDPGATVTIDVDIDSDFEETPGDSVLAYDPDRNDYRPKTLDEVMAGGGIPLSTAAVNTAITSGLSSAAAQAIADTDQLRGTFVAYAPPPSGADDAPMLQSVLSELQDGDTLRFPALTYRIESALTIDVPVTLEGNGTVLDIFVQRPLIAAASNVRIVGVRFRGHPSTMSAGHHQLFAQKTDTTDCVNWTIADCIFEGLGVTFSRKGAMTASGSVNTAGTDIVSGIKFLRNEVYGSWSQYAVAADGVSDALIEGNWIHDNGTDDNLKGEGVKVMSGAMGVRVIGNTIERNKRDAIDVYSAGSVVVMGNTLRDNAHWGLEAKWYITDPNELKRPHLTVVNNQAYGNGSGGLNVGVPGAVIEGNKCWGHTGQNIRTGSAVDAAGTATVGQSISNNITDGGTYGIIVNDAVTRCVIQGNICNDASAVGIALSAASADCIVANNQAEDNGSHGILIDGTGHVVSSNRSQDEGNAYFVTPVPDPNRRAVRKGASTSRLSTSVPSVDGDLVFSDMPAGSAWSVRGVLWAQSASEIPDLKLALQGPAGATSRMSVLGPSISATSWGAALLQTGTDMGVNRSVGVDEEQYGALRIDAIVTIGATAGAVQLMWSQNTSDATPTTLLSGSYLIAERIA